MYIKKLITNEAEYWQLALPFVLWAENHNRSLWREEDLPKLKPFFDRSGLDGHKKPWSKEDEESFDFYKQCRKQYADENTEIRDSVANISLNSVIEAFGYDALDDLSEDGVEYIEQSYCADVIPQLSKDFDATFPFVIIGFIDSGFDRMGKFSNLGLYRVSLNDFSQPIAVQ